ncbi:hypothetical protein Lal_00042240 [Lupinus albus]|nr:hypothetical protein Lal_00042240 [Lupinus albus]
MHVTDERTGTVSAGSMGGRYKQVREEGKGLTPFQIQSEKKEWRGERATWKLVTVVQRRLRKQVISETADVRIKEVDYNLGTKLNAACSEIIREARSTEGLKTLDRTSRERMGSSTPGSPGSTTAGPNHTQKKSLILAQKER